MWKPVRVQFHLEESTSLYMAGSELLETAARGNRGTSKFKMRCDPQIGSKKQIIKVWGGGAHFSSPKQEP